MPKYLGKVSYSVEGAHGRIQDEVAEWLRELDGSVGRAPIRIGLRVETRYPHGGS